VTVVVGTNVVDDQLEIAVVVIGAETLTVVALDAEVPKVCAVVVTGAELVEVVAAEENCGRATNSPRQLMHSQFMALVSGCGKTQQIV
jgi:hypothetical protein